MDPRSKSSAVSTAFLNLLEQANAHAAVKVGAPRLELYQGKLTAEYGALSPEAHDSIR